MSATSAVCGSKRLRVESCGGILSSAPPPSLSGVSQKKKESGTFKLHGTRRTGIQTVVCRRVRVAPPPTLARPALRGVCKRCEIHESYLPLCEQEGLGFLFHFLDCQVRSELIVDNRACVGGTIAPIAPRSKAKHSTAQHSTSTYQAIAVLCRSRQVPLTHALLPMPIASTTSQGCVSECNKCDRTQKKHAVSPVVII